MLDAYEDGLKHRFSEIRERISSAAAASGRSADEVRIVAVSKTVGIDEVLAAIRVGYRSFGENRPQELHAKLQGLAAASPEVTPHFELIGNLQTNKINAVLGRVDLIHSISSMHLARAVSKRAERLAGEDPHFSEQAVLLEVNVSGERTKAGFSPDELRAAIDDLKELSGIRICGLMTMAPRGNADEARHCFEGLRLLRDELVSCHPDLNLVELSCGMSEDFEEAVSEGSTIVRLGRVVFDPVFALK
ncbi:YggS family pyridoxal phosphate-dependent enzyme [Collinsella sp. AGMB00827]|uniref:Pyridoxal phosphate homeostasis protein n=1 Tax=Collinsella ureilytica TaxID=2869515 RepID=A0ABS7MNC7_9ACTN|nr:YggS family pyridoxal phosphate-dependent enzyme [Collinsella urealyticum]MBY4797915.1 YggS family pyridoxal phosphate-dependent enzyme [Collinsella urealyticum]